MATLKVQRTHDHTVSLHVKIASTPRADLGGGCKGCTPHTFFWDYMQLSKKLVFCQKMWRGWTIIVIYSEALKFEVLELFSMHHLHMSYPWVSFYVYTLPPKILDPPLSTLFLQYNSFKCYHCLYSLELLHANLVTCYHCCFHVFGLFLFLSWTQWKLIKKRQCFILGTF